MKIHEDLVFDKSSGEIVGFVDAGDFNNKMRLLEEQCNGNDHDVIATHMLTLMIRGIFIKLNFPYAQFPTSGDYRKLAFIIIMITQLHSQVHRE